MSGQDSFLDLVSNIVGILIILVMVAGIRAQYSSAHVDHPLQIAADPQVLADLDAKYHELQTKEAAAAHLQSELEELQIQSEIIVEHLYRQSREYAALFDLMTSMRASIELAAEEKSQTFKEKIEYQRQLQEMNAKLEQLDRAKAYFRQISPKTTVMENIPTPLSQQVEGKEIHLRLLGGRVAYVPLEELLIQLGGHMGEEKHRYFKQGSSVGRVGPIENFELEFLIVSSQNGFGLQYAEVVSKLEPLGQPLQQALASPQSEFCRKLSLFQKNLYTVTVWVYPDSFDEYQQLRQFLREQGYSVAARPMTMGSPIAVSPHGTRTSTQ